MIKFILSLAKPYGSLSIQSEDEEELLGSVSRLNKLGLSIDKLLVSDIEPSHDIISACKVLSNAQRVLVALFIANRALERKLYIKLSTKLGVPIGWWNGSNFQRDLRKLPPGLTERTVSDGKSALKLTAAGKRYARSLLSKVNQ